MTMMIHTAVPAPVRPQIRKTLGLFAKIARFLVQGHRNSREAQKFLRAHDVMLKDAGFTRLKVNGKAYLFPDRGN